jgi:Acetyltransferase (GNAT) domain
MPVESTEREHTAAGRFSIRGYHPGDERQILALFERSFHQSLSLPRWRWRYEDDPSGNERISMAFYADGHLVAHYAGYPVSLRLNGRDLLANQIGDTMTEVSVRHIGRGPTSLLARVATHFYETFCQRTVAFNYGANVANIRKFSVHFLKAEPIEDHFFRCRDVLRDPMKPMPRWRRKMAGYSMEVVRQVTPEWDSFFARVEPQYGFLARRDRRYLQWRYLDCPDVDYVMVAARRWGRLTGWVVFRIIDDRVVWGDALIDPAHPECLQILVGHMVPIFASHGVGTIEGWFPARPAWFAALLDEMRLTLEPEPQGLGLICVPFGLGTAAQQIRSLLYYTKGDFDLF